MVSVQDKLVTRLKRLCRGKVVTPKDFLDLGTRDATDQAIHRLVKTGLLIRLGRGLYHFPRENARLGLTPPPAPDDIAAALGRQLGSRVTPSGALAANQLGLSTQVPTLLVYHTDGRSRSLRVGKLQLRFKHVAPKELPAGSPTSAAVFQALRFIGRDAVDRRVVATLRSRLTPVQRRTLARDAKYAADWMMDVARRVAANDEAGKEDGHDG